MTSKQGPEEQILNFLVYALTDEFTLNLGGNADVDPETVFEVLVGACADGTSVSSVCKTSEEAQHENTVLHHLQEKFDLSSVERAGNNLLQTDLLESLPEQVEVVVDLYLRPYYGDKADTDGLYHSEAKRGTTAFHGYATLYARVRNKRYTLVVRRLVHGDTASSVLAEFFGLLDREFYDSKCLTLLQEHNHAYVMPIVRWGKTIKQELSAGWSRVIDHDLTERKCYRHFLTYASSESSALTEEEVQREKCVQPLNDAVTV